MEVVFFDANVSMLDNLDTQSFKTAGTSQDEKTLLICSSGLICNQAVLCWQIYAIDMMKYQVVVTYTFFTRNSP